MAELEFIQAVLKRGFINIPRIVFDYMGDLNLDYHLIGKLFTVMACVGGPGESPFEPYTLSRRNISGDYEQMRGLIKELQHQDVVMLHDENDDQVTFSLVPLLAKLRVFWQLYREQYDEQKANGVIHPAVTAVEKMLGRTLSDRDVQEVQDWIDQYHFDTEMVLTICREGLNQGVTRMNYLSQIALQWFEDGIRTPEEAEEHSQRYRKSAARYKTILPYLGLKRQLNKAEEALLQRWTEEWGFSSEVVIRACAEAVGSHNPVQYVNRILTSWQEQGVRTVADAEQVMSEYKRRPAQANPSKGGRAQKSPSWSNVILRDEGEKDDSEYDYLYKKYRD